MFNAETWYELKKVLRNDPIKAALIPHIPNIISTGERSDSPAHHTKPDIKRVFTFTKKVQTAEGLKEVIVDVNLVKKDKSLHIYNLTREGTGNYEARKKAGYLGRV